MFKHEQQFLEQKIQTLTCSSFLSRISEMLFYGGKQAQSCFQRGSQLQHGQQGTSPGRAVLPSRSAPRHCLWWRGILLIVHVLFVNLPVID